MLTPPPVNVLLKNKKFLSILASYSFYLLLSVLLFMPVQVFGQADNSFFLEIFIDELDGNDGTFEVHLDVNEDSSNDDYCEMFVDIRFDYYAVLEPDVDVDEVVYTIDLPKDYDTGQDEFLTFGSQVEVSGILWHPNNHRYDYVITVPECAALELGGVPITLNDIQSVVITTNIFDTSCPDETVSTIQHKVNYPDGSEEFINCGTFSGLVPCETIHQFPVTSFYNNGLAFGLSPSSGSNFLNICDFGNTAYAIPYGGCPPYLHEWSDENGDLVDSYIQTSGAHRDFDNVLTLPAGTNATLFATITDSEAQSIGPQSYTFTDNSEVTVETIINCSEPTCECILSVNASGGSEDYEITGVHISSMSLPPTSGPGLNNYRITQNGVHTIKVLDLVTRCEFFEVITFSENYLFPQIDGDFSICENVDIGVMEVMPDIYDNVIQLRKGYKKKGYFSNFVDV